EEVYVCQTPGFKDPDHHDKVVKALYGLHQAPRAWFETLANYLLDNGFERGKIDQTSFIKRQKGYILLVKIYVDDIIFGATNKDLCKSFEKLIKDKLKIRKQVGDLATYTTKYISPALTPKLFANIRRVGKGFFGIETALFKGMLVAQVVGEGVADEVHDEGVPAAGVATEGDVSAANDEVPIVAEEPSIPSPAPPTPPPQPSHDIPSTFPSITNTTTITSVLSRRVEHLELDKIAQDLEITELKRRVKKLERRNKVKEDESEPAEVQEVVDVVTTAKIITEVVTAASEIITAASTTITAAEAQVPAFTLTAAPARVTAAPSRRRKGVDEVIDHVKRKAKEDLDVKKYQALKRKPQTEAQARKNRMLYLKNVAGFKMDYFKGISYDDIPLGEMFEKLDIHAQIWKNQRSVHGLTKVKGWKLLESYGVHIKTFTTTQQILPSDIPVCYLCTCEQCGNILNYGTCLNCNSGTGNSFTYDTILESYDEVPNPPPQCHFNVYSCQICINPLIDHHCCYECGSSLNDFFCPHYSCEFCGNGAHVGYNCPAQCQPKNHDYYNEQNSCYDSNSFGFDHGQPPRYTVNHPIFNAHNDLLTSQTTLMEQMTQLTSMCEMFCQIIQSKQEEKRIEEEQAANAQYWNIPACCDDDDDYNSAITPNEPIDSLSIGDEHLNTISTTESDEFIKSCVENLVPNPSEFEGKNGCDVPACFTTFLNILFDADYVFDSSDYQSCSDEDFLKEIFSNPLFEEEIIPMKIDQHHFNAESDLIESMLNHDSSIIPSSSKIDSLLDEFVVELTLLKSIQSRINETDCYPEEDIHLIERLLYDNSSPHLLKEFVSDNSDADIESFSPFPIPVKESDSHMKEIDLPFTSDDSMPSALRKMIMTLKGIIPRNVKTLAKGFYPPSLHFLSFNWESCDVTRLQALVNTKKIVISEAVLHEILQLNDPEGMVCLPNKEIFAGLAQMGYEKPTSWNEFSTSMASVVICLSKGQRFNFSKYIFDSLVRNVDSSSKFYMYPRFIQLIIQAQVGDLSSHTTRFISLVLTQKVFANMRRVRKGFSGIETPLFEGMLADSQPADEELGAEQVQVNAAIVEDIVETVVEDVSHNTIPSSPSHVIPSPSQEPSSPSQQPHVTPPVPTQGEALPANFHQVLNTCSALINVGTSRRVESSDDMEDVFNKERMIADMDMNEGIELVKDTEVAESEGRHAVKQAAKQAEIYHIDLDHPSKVLSMQEDDSKVQEVVEVVTTAKLITEVTTAASQVSAANITIPAVSTTIPAVSVTIPAANPSIPAAYTRRRKGVIIRDPEEELPLNTPDETPKYIKRYHRMKKRPQTESEARKNMILYLKNTAGYKMDFFKGLSYADICPIFQARFDENIRFLFKTKEEMEAEDEEIIKSINETPKQKVAKRRKLNEEAQEAEALKKQLEIVHDEDDDVFTEATPLGRKVPVVDYEIVMINNKPRYKIIRADDTYQLYISFITLLKNFNREDLEDLWRIVKDRFSTSKPTNFSDDYLLSTLKTMFEKTDGQDAI
nr:putative ribonuclease H-like domain-containing protein [Tanacetum cinerariifolium]